MAVSFENDTIRTAGRAAHEIGLAAILGGNLFARIGMHPALSEVSNPRERGKVVNAVDRVRPLHLRSLQTQRRRAPRPSTSAAGPTTFGP